MGVRRNDDVVKGRQRFEVGENVTPRHFVGAFGETGAPHGRLVSLGAIGPQRARVDITGARRTLACHGRASVGDESWASRMCDESTKALALEFIPTGAVDE